MTPLKQKLTIQQGRTFRLPVRWESEVFGYAPIASISKAAPCRVVTQNPHGIPDGWRVAIVSAGGMVEANAVNSPPSEDEMRRATLISPVEVEFNSLNAAGFTTYTSGGYLQFRIPVDLTGFDARMTIRDKVGGVELLTLTTVNGRLVVSPSEKYVEIVISATDTAALTWKSGVYDLELVSPSGEVTALLTGGVAVLAEITT